MNHLAPDRLWPVLAALIALLAGALALQIMADGREADARTIVIERGADALLRDKEDAPGDALVEDEPVDEVHARARREARRGKLDEALRSFEEAAAAHPDSARIHAEYGYWLLAADRDTAGLAALEKAARLAPDSAWIAMNLGVASSRTHHTKAAERHFRRALKLQPGYGAAELALGNLLRRSGRLDEAISVLEHAASSGGNEERARALVALGRAYLGQKRREDAEHAFTRAVERAPAAAEVRVGVARAYLASGSRKDVQKAVEVLRRTVAIAPDVAKVHALLGHALEKLGDAAGAEKSYQTVLSLEPGNTHARRRLLRLALERHDFPRARMHVEYLLREDPDDPEHSFLAGLVAARADLVTEARQDYRRAIDKAKGDYPEAYFNLGLLEKKAGHLDEAIEHYKKAVELRPSYRAARNNLGLAYAAAGRAAEAEETFRGLVSDEPDYASGWLNLGKLLSEQKRYDDAIAAYKKALEVRPGYPAARLDMAVAYRRAGRNQDAVRTYRALVSEHPRYVSAWHNLAIALADSGAKRDALEAASRALELDPNHVPSIRLSARLNRDLGDLERAADLFEDAVDHEPADVDTRLALAEVLERRGDRQGCLRHARAALAQRPGDSEAARAVNECREAR